MKDLLKWVRSLVGLYIWNDVPNYLLYNIHNYSYTHSITGIVEKDEGFIMVCCINDVDDNKTVTEIVNSVLQEINPEFVRYKTLRREIEAEIGKARNPK